jgi:acetolactate synthase-1/2/3 large subunit
VATVRAMELPLIFLSGASPVRNDGYGNFQELDQASTCRSVCKASFNAATVESIPSIFGEAWALSQAGIPGPVHISLPADVLLASAEHVATVEAAVNSSSLRHDRRIFQPSNILGELQSIVDHLLESVRPMVIVRPAASRGETGALVDRLARQLGVQAVITGPPRGLADSKYAHLTSLYKRSDCALVIGPSDYSLGFLAESIIAEYGKILLIDAEGDPKPRRKPAVHVQLPIMEAVKFLAEATSSYRCRDEGWSRAWLTPPAPETRPAPHEGRIHPLEVAMQVGEVLLPDDILVVDGGEFCQWARLGLRGTENRWLWNSKFGLIGNSIPMALGVSVHGHPGRTIAIMGDGGAGYHLLEFETAARYGIPIVAIIGNDAQWSAEWHIQVDRYGPDRTFETNLSTARYDQAAAGLGAQGFHARDTKELRDALSTAFASGKPSCINVEIQSPRSPAAPP